MSQLTSAQDCATAAGSCGRFARTGDPFFTTVSAPKQTRVFPSIRVSRFYSAADMKPITHVKSLPMIPRRHDPRHCTGRDLRSRYACGSERSPVFAAQSLQLLNLIANCHPEQGEGSGCLLAAAALVTQARTQIPPFARDDNVVRSQQHVKRAQKVSRSRVLWPASSTCCRPAPSSSHPSQFRRATDG
jgi:hypothetical protein